MSGPSLCFPAPVTTNKNVRSPKSLLLFCYSAVSDSLQGIFLIQGSNPCLLLWQVSSLPLSHQGSPQYPKYPWINHSQSISGGIGSCVEKNRASWIKTALGEETGIRQNIGVVCKVNTQTHTLWSHIV